MILGAIFAWLGKLAWKGFCFAYGLFCLLAMLPIAVFRDGIWFTRRRKLGQTEQRELEKYQRQYWHLVAQPMDGFRHEFFIRDIFNAGTDLKLHYVVSVDSPPNSPSSPNIAIFIHGFPDSHTLWTRIITSERLKNYTCIAVDLPGYGGSDNLPEYNAENMLNAMSYFILEMREKYLKAGGRVVMVTHDWGAIIGARLAAEAPELADRWILTSALLPFHVLSKATDDLKAAGWQISAFLRRPFQLNTRQPLKLHHLSVAWDVLSPLRSQIMRSFYIFILTLPLPLANWFACFGNFWFLRTLHLVKCGRLKSDENLSIPFSPKESADHMAQSAGPGTWELQNTLTPQSRGGRGYEKDVAQRIPHFGMKEKIKIYRDGLIWGEWKQSDHLRSKLDQLHEPSSAAPRHSPSSATPTTTTPARAPHQQSTSVTLEAETDDKIGYEALRGRLRVPTTMIMGKEDPAFEPRMVLGGVEDYLPQESQVVVLKKGGHWLPAEEVSSVVIEHVVSWALGGEEGSIRTCLERFDEWEMVAEK